MRVLDYILDNDNNFWIVKKIIDKKAYGELVYKVSKGGRYNHITKRYYKKVINDNLEKLIYIKRYKKTFSANKFLEDNFENLDKKWKQLVELLMEIGIKKANIGIFGSYLIGFDVIKDIDFVVYKQKSYELVKSNIEYIRKELGATSISDEHISYQVNKYQHRYNINNDLGKIIKHNWVGIQFGKNVLSSIRFVKNNVHYHNFKGKEKIIEGIVVNGEGTNFLPRVGLVKSADKKIKVITYFWMFNAFLSIGDKILVKGLYNRKKKEIYLININHYIKYL